MNKNEQKRLRVHKTTHKVETQPKIVISFGIEAEVLEAVDNQASKHERSRSQMINRLLRKALNGSLTRAEATA